MFVEYIISSRLLMTSQSNPEESDKVKVTPQRKTTLKWGNNGELSAIDMAQILDKLKNQQLTKCDIKEE